jgi:hypothetical protein
MKTIFKEGDKVFDIQYGWGIVKRIDFDANYPIFCRFDNDKQCYSIDGKIISGAIPTLSFTEYTLEGFSQEREPKKGQPVWVRDSSADSWLISQFISYSPLSSYPYAVSDDMRIESRMNFKFMTTENPYINPNEQ